MASGKTVIVTGASQGIGVAIVRAFLERSYNVVATSRSISKAGHAPSFNLELVDGNISLAETAVVAMGTISEPKDIDDAVVYLTEASHVTGEVLHVDDGAHVDRW